MATTREDFARCVERIGEAPRGGGDRAQRLLPERPLGADRRREPERDRGAAGGAAPADREAADREADAERRRPRGGRGRGRAGRRRRGLADQHAEGRPRSTRRPASPRSATATAASRGRRCGRSRSSRSRSVRGRGRPADRSAWGGSRAAPTRPNSSPSGPRVVAVGTENFRDPRAGSRVAAELESTLRL